MINIQTFLDCLRLVIVTEYKLVTTGIADTFCLRCCKYNVISCTTFHTCTASAHTFHDVLIRHIHIDCIVNFASKFIQSFCQTFCLRNCSWKTIQNIPFSCVLLLDSVNNKVAGQFIRNKKSLIHVSFCFFSKLSTVLDVGTENISCGDVRNSIFRRNFLSLSTFACPRCTQHNNSHSIPSIFLFSA